MNKNKKLNKEKNKITKISIEDIYKLPDSKKLFILREAIDLLALGIPVNQQVIDACYDELLNALQDYKWLQAEFENNLQEYSAAMNNLEPNIINSEEDGYLSNEISETGETSSSTLSLQDKVQKLYGDSWQKLEDGLDELNEKHGTYYRVYMYPQTDKKNIKLKIFDDHDITLKRVYDDKEDLDINLEKDIKTNFSGPKIKISQMKLDLKNKKNNKE